MRIICKELITHRGVKRFKLLYDYKAGNVADTLVRQIPGRTWSKTLRAWHIPYSENVDEIINKMNLQINQTNTLDTPTTAKKTASVVIDKVAKRIFLKHDYQKLLFNEVRKIKTAYWIKDSKQWCLKGDNEIYVALIKLLQNYNFNFTRTFKEHTFEKETIPTVKFYIESLQMKNYSINTIEAYLPYFKKFVTNLKPDDIHLISNFQLVKYVKNEIRTEKLSEQQQKHLISALKFYYEKILGRQKIYFPLRKQTKLAQEKILIEFENISNEIDRTETPAQKLFLILHYCFGLSCENIANLSLDEFKQIFNNFKQNKEKKQLYEYLINIIKEYYTKHRPKKYLFEKRAETPYSADELEKKLFAICKKFKIIEIHRFLIKELCNQADYSYKTAKSYSGCFASFIVKQNYEHPDNIGEEAIRKFLVELAKNHDLTESTSNQFINVFTFYYERFRKRKIQLTTLLRPKIRKTIPTILSAEEIHKIIDSIENLKHRCLIMLLYSGGLRKSELINLRKKDIDFELNQIKIIDGKGKKSRITLLSENLKIELKNYFDRYKIEEYLFEGASGGAYSETSIRNILKKALAKTHISKYVTLHTLRHSFATHLIENGVDVSILQKLLGHSDIKTTIKYVHLANNRIKKIENPLDKIFRESKKNNSELPP